MIGTALALGLGIASAAGGVASSALGAHAAGKAANAQASAADRAAQLQHEDAQAALDFQKQQYNQNREDLAPWLKAGTGAINTLSGLLSTPGQGLLTPFDEKFQSPTDVTEKNDPGYQFRLSQGMKALQASAAARGGVLSGGTGKALARYGQDYASNEYGNVYNRALGEYNNRFNIFEANQNSEYNKLAGISGAGQTTAAQLGQQGQQAAGNIANINLTSGQQIGNDYQNAAAARASGYVGSANAWGSSIGNGINNLSQLLLLSKYGQPSTSSRIIY